MSSEYSLQPVGSPEYTQLNGMREGDEIIPTSDGSNSTSFRRKVRSQRMLTETQDVKVPVLVPRVEETEYKIKVPIQKLVEETTWVDVEETYTAFEEKNEPVTTKEWVMETTTEQYEVKVPVTKTRTVKVPFKRLEERDEIMEVDVPTTRVERVTGYRVDEIEDRKVVEVEEWEIFELVACPTGETVAGEELRDLGPLEDHSGARTMGTKIYKASDMRVAKRDGYDLASIPTDRSQVDTQAALFVGKDGYTSGFLGADEANGPYDRVGPAEDKPAVSSGAPEEFDLEKCLAYASKELKAINDPDLDVDEFMDQLESRWRFVDADCGGKVEKEELRLAVWNTEEDNAGVPMPKGDFTKALQDIVDEIWIGCGSKDAFTIWDFVRFMLNEQLLEHLVVKTPPASEGWAHA